MSNMTFSQMIANYPLATPDHMANSQHQQTLLNLLQLLGAGKLIYIDSPIAIDGDLIQAQGNVGLVLEDSQGQASNLLLYPPQGKPYLLQSFADDGLVLHGGDDWIAVESIDTAVQLASLSDESYTIIAPPESYPRQFENLIKAFAKDRQITVFCDGSNSKDYSKTYDGHNVRLAVITDTLLNAVEYSGSLAGVLADELTIIKELGAFKWGVPEPLADTHKFNNPFPRNAFSNDLQAVIERASYYYQTPPSVAGFAILGALSTMIQPYVNSPFDSGHNPVSLFLMVELASGGGKTQINNYIYREINAISQQLYKKYHEENNAYHAELAGLRGKERADYLKDTPPPKNEAFTMASGTLQYITRKFIIDGNYNLAINSGEAGKMMGSHSMKAENIHDTISTFADLYSGQKVEYNTSGNQKDTGKTQAFDCRLTIDVSGQPIVLKEVISNPLLMAQGFLARFLISCPPSLIGNRVFNDTDRENLNAWHDPALLTFWQRCRDFYDRVPSDNGKNTDGTPDRFNMPFGDGARRYLNAYRQTCENRLTGKFKDFQETAQRLAENASRIATLFAYFDGLKVLPIKYIERGILLAEYSINELMRYNDQQQATQKNDSEKLIEWLLKQCKSKGISKIGYAETQSKVNPKDLRRKAEFELCVEVLTVKHYLRVIQQGNSRLIELNPCLLK